MEFKYGDRIHVTKFDGNLVDFYATVSCVYGMTVEIKNCTDTTYEEEVLYIPYSKSFGANRDDYFELVLDEEDTEDTVIHKLIELSDKGLLGRTILNINSSINFAKTDKSLAFYIINDDMTMTLIWTKEKGLVE